MTRFFADEAIPQAGGATDIVAALARNGVQTDAEKETVIPEITTTTTTTNTETASTANETPAVEPTKVEVKTEEPIISTSTKEEQIAVPNWRDEFKKADKADILKELGFDEKMLGFYNTWMTGGDIGNYLKAVSIDYSKMTPEQLMKQQLSEQYPEFSAEDLEELYRAKIIDQYKLDPEIYNEQEIRRGKLLLQADAKAVRESMIERQKQFVMNVKPPEIPDFRKEMEAQEKQQQEFNAKVLDQYKAQLTSHSATKELLGQKKLVIGEGDDKFNYEVSDPQKALDVLQDPMLWAKNVFNEDGTPQIEKQLFLAAAAIDYKGLAREIFKAGKAMGAKQAIEPIENAKKPDAPTTSTEQILSPAQALARSGVLSEG